MVAGKINTYFADLLAHTATQCKNIQNSDCFVFKIIWVSE